MEQNDLLDNIKLELDCIIFEIVDVSLAMHKKKITSDVFAFTSKMK